MTIPAQSTPLTPLQLEMLRLFAKDLPESYLIEIKQLLAKFFAEKASQEMDAFIEGQGLTVDEWVDSTMKEHLRTPYRPQSGSTYHSE